MISCANKFIAEEILDALVTAVGPGPVALHEPDFSGNEWQYLKQCLDSTYVSSVGEFVDQFESRLTDFTGAKYAIAVMNGTAALHIALLLAGVSRNDEVLVPALTFVATANAVTYCGATPHFIESEESTLGIDPKRLYQYLEQSTDQRSGNCVNAASGNVIRAIVPMHTFGHSASMSEVMTLAEDFNITVVEDAAESLGSYYHGRHTGTIGLLGTLSFNGNKTITTGGGGAILTNDSELSRLAKHLSTTAKQPHSWEYKHNLVGYNYRMPNLNAALGCAQLEQLLDKLERKRRLYDKYRQALQGIKGVSLVAEPDRCKSNYWLQTLVLSPENSEMRDEILSITNSAGYMTRPAWNLISEMDAYLNCPRMSLDCAASLANRIINIPSSAFLIDR
jgi:aminotransferase in exopolysaccharide biosynthesis